MPSQIIPSDHQPLEEFLWAPQVHEAFGEQLRFYFIRTAYSKMAAKEFEAILGQHGHPAITYLLFGQFDFLVRIWATPVAQAELEMQFKEFAHRFLGDSVPIEVPKVFYPWATVKPDNNRVDVFCREIQRLSSRDRGRYVLDNEHRLKTEGLIIDRMANRKRHKLKAFTIIRNLSTSPHSYKLMERVLRDEVRAFGDAGGRLLGDQPDATLYSTKGSFHFIVRWGSDDYELLSSAISDLTEKLEAEDFAALFETCFRAKPLGEEQENPGPFRSLGGVAISAKSALDEVLPELSDADVVRANLVRQLVAVPDLGFSPLLISESPILREVFSSYLTSNRPAFEAFISKYYSQFETLLRNHVLKNFGWPEHESDQERVLEEWKLLLGKSQVISTGTEGGRRVPKLSLGDLVNLSRKKRPEAFDASIEARLREVLKFRNDLSHAVAAVDFHQLMPFLAQVSACSALLRGLAIVPKMPKS